MKMLIGLILCSSIMLISGANVSLSSVTTSSNSFTTKLNPTSSTTSMPVLSPNSTTLIANLTSTPMPVVSTNSATSTPAPSTNSSAPSNSTVIEDSQLVSTTKQITSLTQYSTSPKYLKTTSYTLTKVTKIFANGTNNVDRKILDQKPIYTENENKKVSADEWKINGYNGSSITVKLTAFISASYRNISNSDLSTYSRIYLPSNKMTQVSGNCDGENKIIKISWTVDNLYSDWIEFHFSKFSYENNSVYRLEGFNVSATSMGLKEFDMNATMPSHYLIVDCTGVTELCRYRIDEQEIRTTNNVESKVHLILKNFEFQIIENGDSIIENPDSIIKNADSIAENPNTFVYPGHTATIGIGFLVLILFIIICVAIYQYGKYNGYKKVNRI